MVEDRREVVEAIVQALHGGQPENPEAQAVELLDLLRAYLVPLAVEAVRAEGAGAPAEGPDADTDGSRVLVASQPELAEARDPYRERIWQERFAALTRERDALRAELGRRTVERDEARAEVARLTSALDVHIAVGPEAVDRVLDADAALAKIGGGWWHR